MKNKTKIKLSRNMTLNEFDSGYWYALELKEFAKALEIPSYSKLRKDEIEKAIKIFLKTGKKVIPTKRSLVKYGTKDSDGRLTLKKIVGNYTNDRKTKDWIVKKAKELDSRFKERSGARLRLNRWREDQLTKENQITYGDLVHQFIKINDPTTKYKKYPSGRYINFLSDFLKKEKNASHESAISAWHSLKKLDLPKSYSAWKSYQNSK